MPYNHVHQEYINSRMIFSSLTACNWIDFRTNIQYKLFQKNNINIWLFSDWNILISHSMYTLWFLFRCMPSSEFRYLVFICFYLIFYLYTTSDFLFNHGMEYIKCLFEIRELNSLKNVIRKIGVYEFALIN